MGLKTLFSGGSGGNGRYSKAKEDHTSLGNILLEKGYVSEDTLEKAIKVQKSQSLLGRILVNMGAITEEELEDVLFEQKIRRKEARDKDVIRANSKHHRRLVDEVQEQLVSLDGKYAIAGKK